MQTISSRIDCIIDAECGGKATRFAERLGINSANVSKWRSGLTAPSRQTIQQIADAFGYNADWLESGTGEPRALAPLDEQIVDALSHAMKYKSSSADRFIRAVAAAAASGDDAAIDATIGFLEKIVQEYSRTPPE